jgi:glycerophosphoryl diester phosphodiesterase
MIEIVCHRGANELAPENTYASSQICLDWGVHYVEIDVSTSADGVLYVIHGPGLERTTNGTGRIGQHTADTIDQLDAGSWFDPKFSDQRIPRVDEFLGWIKGKSKVYFDVKTASHESIVEVVRRHGFEKDCFFWSGDNDWSLGLKEQVPDLPIKVNVNSLASLIKRHDAYRMDIIEIGLENVTPEILSEAKSRNIRVMVYHQENDPDAFNRIIDWDVEMVNLNHADSFFEVLESRTKSGQ